MNQLISCTNLLYPIRYLPLCLFAVFQRLLKVRLGNYLIAAQHCFEFPQGVSFTAAMTDKKGDLFAAHGGL